MRVTITKQPQERRWRHLPLGTMFRSAERPDLTAVWFVASYSTATEPKASEKVAVLLSCSGEPRWVIQEPLDDMRVEVLGVLELDMEA